MSARKMAGTGRWKHRRRKQSWPAVEESGYHGEDKQHVVIMETDKQHVVVMVMDRELTCSKESTQ